MTLFAPLSRCDGGRGGDVAHLGCIPRLNDSTIALRLHGDALSEHGRDPSTFKEPTRCIVQDHVFVLERKEVKARDTCVGMCGEQRIGMDPDMRNLGQRSEASHLAGILYHIRAQMYLLECA